MINLEQPVDHYLDVLVKRRNVGSHTGQSQENAIVFQRMMRCAHDAVAVTASIPHQYDGKPVKADVIANLLEGSRIDERCDAVDPGPQTFPCEARGHRDHILFGDPGVDEPLAQGVSQWLQCLVSKITGEK